MESYWQYEKYENKRSAQHSPAARDAFRRDVHPISGKGRRSHTGTVREFARRIRQVSRK